jgi:hypothetical protein
MTHVYCVYDANNLYIAFLCKDSSPADMSAKLAPRESTQMGDAVAVFLDTFYDRQNAYLFQTNALGIQFDARISEDGAVMDRSWDGIWWAEGRLTTAGWIVEIMIPFTTLRFPYSQRQVWSVQFWRYIERLEETSYWVPVNRSEGFGVSRFGNLVGMRDIRQGIHLEILPHAVSRGTMEQDEELMAEADGGLDLKWGLVSDLTLDMTVNPDFGQVEADPEYINLTRYEYFLPERRPFFLEGKDLVDSLFFYSRRIGKKLTDGTEVPILGGARLSGKAYGTSFLVASAATEGVRSDTLREPPALYSIGRVKFDLLGSSNVGFTVSGKDTSGGHARCTGMDAHLRPFSATELTARLARTWNTDVDKEGYLGMISGNFRSADWSAGASYRDIGKDFRVEEFGYVPAVGDKSHSSYLRFHPRLNRMGIRSYSISLNYATDRRYEHPVWSWYAGPSFSLSLANLWHPWAGAYFGNKYEVGTERSYSYLYAGLATDYRRALSATLSLHQFGTYNYRGAYFGHYRKGYLELAVKPSTNIRISGNIESVAEYRDDWTLDEWSWTSSQRLQLSITRDLHLRVYALQNTYTKRYTGNGLVEWEFSPGSRVYLALNEVRDDTQGDLRLNERIFFLKISYLLIM